MVGYFWLTGCGAALTASWLRSLSPTSPASISPELQSELNVGGEKKGYENMSSLRMGPHNKQMEQLHWRFQGQRAEDLD